MGLRILGFRGLGILGMWDLGGVFYFGLWVKDFWDW